MVGLVVNKMGQESVLRTVGVLNLSKVRILTFSQKRKSNFSSSQLFDAVKTPAPAETLAVPLDIT